MLTNTNTNVLNRSASIGSQLISCVTVGFVGVCDTLARCLAASPLAHVGRFKRDAKSVSQRQDERRQCIAISGLQILPALAGEPAVMQMPMRYLSRHNGRWSSGHHC